MPLSLSEVFLVLAQIKPEWLCWATPGGFGNAHIACLWNQRAQGHFAYTFVWRSICILLLSERVSVCVCVCVTCVLWKGRIAGGGGASGCILPPDLAGEVQATPFYSVLCRLFLLCRIIRIGVTLSDRLHRYVPLAHAAFPSWHDHNRIESVSIGHSCPFPVF